MTKFLASSGRTFAILFLFASILGYTPARAATENFCTDAQKSAYQEKGLAAFQNMTQEQLAQCAKALGLLTLHNKENAIVEVRVPWTPPSKRAGETTRLELKPGDGFTPNGSSGSISVTPVFTSYTTERGGTYLAGPGISILAQPDQYCYTALAIGPIYCFSYKNGQAIWNGGTPAGAVYPSAGSVTVSNFYAYNVVAPQWGTFSNPSRGVIYTQQGISLTSWAADNYLSDAWNLVDLDGDGEMEFCGGEQNWKYECRQPNGTVLWSLHAMHSQKVQTGATPDLDGDGKPDVVTLDGGSSGGQGMYARANNGTVLWDNDFLGGYHYPVVNTTAGDVDGDGHPELTYLTYGAGSPFTPTLIIVGYTGTIQATIELTGDINYGGQVSLADFDGCGPNGTPEMIVQLAGQVTVVGYKNGQHQVLWSRQWDPSQTWNADYSPIIGDLNGDDYQDIVVGGQKAGSALYGAVYAYDRFGNPLSGFPISGELGSGGTGAILPEKGLLVLKASPWDGYSGSKATGYGIEIPKSNTPAAWPQYMHDPARSGVYTTVDCPPTVDLSILLRDDHDPIVFGEVVTYTADITLSSAIGQGTVITQQITSGTFITGELFIAPAQGTVVPPSGLQMPDGRIMKAEAPILPGGFVTVSGQLLTATVPYSLTPGVFVILRSIVSPTTWGVLTVTAGVNAPLSVVDSNQINNSAVETTTVFRLVERGADLQVSTTDLVEWVLVNTPLTYTVVVTNNGPEIATNVVVTDVLPWPSEFVGIISQTSPVSYTMITVGDRPGLLFNLASMDAGQVFSFSVIVTPTQGGAVGNTVYVAADQADPAPTNNTAGANTGVLAPEIYVVPNPVSVKEGEVAAFTFKLDTVYPISVSMYYQTKDWSAIAYTDYVPVSGTLMFAPGEITKTIQVATVENFVKNVNKGIIVEYWIDPNALPWGEEIWIQNDDVNVYLPLIRR